MSNFVKIPSGGSGEYIKAAEVEGRTLLVEPKGFIPQQENPFEPGKYRDVGVADVTVFSNDFKVENVLESAKFTNSVLANTVGDVYKGSGDGAMFVGVVTKPAGKRYYNFSSVSPAVEEKIAEYVASRNADFDALLDD